MALRAILKRLAVARRVEMPVFIDRVNDRSAVRSVPIIQMAFRAGRLSCGSAREGAAVTERAVLIGLAVARSVKLAAEIHVVIRPDGHARPILARAHRIIRVPAAQHRESEED